MEERGSRDIPPIPRRQTPTRESTSLRKEETDEELSTSLCPTDYEDGTLQKTAFVVSKLCPFWS